MNIPACADRTVYCTYPPDPYPSGEIKVTTNPSPAYQVPSGKFQILKLTFQNTQLSTSSLIWPSYTIRATILSW